MDDDEVGIKPLSMAGIGVKTNWGQRAGLGVGLETRSCPFNLKDSTTMAEAGRKF